MVSGTQEASLLQPGSTQWCTALPSHFTSEKPLPLLLCLLHLISLEHLDAILNTPFPSFLHFSQPSHHSANAVHANSPKQNPPWEKWLFIALPWSSSSQYLPLLACWGSTSRISCSVWGSSRTTERKKKKDLLAPETISLCSTFPETLLPCLIPFSSVSIPQSVSMLNSSSGAPSKTRNTHPISSSQTY